MQQVASIKGSGTATDSGAASTFTVNNSGADLFNGVITNGTNALSLVKTGTGMLTLAVADTYSGTTTISAGALQVGNAGTTGSLGTGSVTDNAALIFDLSSNVTVANAITGTGTLTQAGTGTIILTGADTYSGMTDISAGTLQVGNGGTSGSLGTGSITDQGVLIFDLTTPATIASAISGSGTLAQKGTGSTIILTGANTYSGTTTISAGTLQVGNAGSTGALGTGSVTDNAALTFDLASTASVESAISGSGTLTQEGPGGTIILSGANTYSGKTAINAGTLQVGMANAIPSTSDVTDNGTLDLHGHSDSIGALTGGGSVTSTAAGIVTLSVGGTNHSGTFSGIIQNGSATVALTTIGTGTETLSGNNTYTGSTTINAGTLEVDGSLESGSPVTVQSGGDLDGVGTVNGTVTAQPGGTLTPGDGVGTLNTGSLALHSAPPSTYN